MSDKEFMWALKNGDLDEVKDYVGKVRSGGWARQPEARPVEGEAGMEGLGKGRGKRQEGPGLANLR